MDIDDEEIPNLVGVGNTADEAQVGDASTAQLQDLSLVKVPLTIVTEFGDSADIEKALTVSQEGQEVQEWLELGNGCICCSIKDFGVNAIESLMERRGTFDYIMLETSGLADPGSLAPLFWVDDGLGSSIYLDGIVTLVDAKNILLSLDEDPPANEHAENLVETPKGSKDHATTAHMQISHADVIIINKCESITAENLTEVEDRIRSINGLANIHKTSYSQVPRLESFLLDLHAYDGVQDLDTSGREHSHIDPSISTITLKFPAQTSLVALETWLREILWENKLPRPNTGPWPNMTSFSVHRTKGRIPTTNAGIKMVQGVRNVFEITDLETGDEAGSDLNTMGKLVLIGRGLNQDYFQRSLEETLSQ